MGAELIGRPDIRLDRGLTGAGPGATLSSMSDETREEVAKRAGVEPAFVDRLVTLGILAPRAGGFAAGDAQRVGVIQALEQAGLPLAGIGEAIRAGAISLDFVDQPSYRHFASLGAETFTDVSARTHIPLDLLLAIREAMGFAQPTPDQRMRDEELRVVPLVELQVREGFRPAAIERWLRVYGESMRRVADTEADWFRTEILDPLFAQGKGPAEVGAVTGRLDADLAQFGDQAVLALFHGQQANAWIKNIFEGFEGSLAALGMHSKLDRPPAICFLDLTGYTRLTDERGDVAAADLAGRLARLVQRTSLKHGGKPVKWLGDGVMFWFREPGPAVLAALEMVEGAATAELPPAHVGLHAGQVLYQQGDYFGRTVNVAARIAAYARQGEVLVSQEVVDASDGTSVAFAEIGPVELKGLSESIRLHVARRVSG
jgi:adenylate cyclase